MISYQQMGCTINILQSTKDVQLDTAIMMMMMNSNNLSFKRKKNIIYKEQPTDCLVHRKLSLPAAA